MIPLQTGVPGGPELLIIFMILALLGVPVLLLSKRGGNDRIEELERRVEDLERELED